jgi:spoIIIJ-associated protein
MQKIKDRIIRILDFYGIEESELEFTEESNDGKVYLNVSLPEDQAKHFIGSKGETLDALEILVRLAHLDDLEDVDRLTIDINGYRKEREQQLQEKALLVAQKVIETEQEYVFNNLNSYERFLVHSAIGEAEEFQNVETFSENDTYGRILVVRLKQN